MKGTIIAVAIAGVLIGGTFMLTNKGGDSDSAGTSVSGNNVSVVDGIQIIEIRAKGGYHPRQSTAKAGLPTVLRFNTAGTFDCSAAVRIPSLGISKTLPQRGSTDIDLGSPGLGTLRGSCGMGMYPFEIVFES